MKLKLFIVALFCSVLGWGQTTLYSENFGTTAVIPTGWTSSNTSAGWNASTASVSGVYAGASAGANMLFNGTGTNGVSHTLTYANNLSTVGYTNITVLWGARSTATFAATVTFQWSSDGTTWNNVSFTNVSANATWSLVNGGVRINLPVGADGVSNLRFRWTSTSTNSGNHRIDDFSVQGTPASSNTITTDAFSGTYCVSASTGASVSVPFTSVGTFNAGNVYTAQLSNAAGVFPGTTIGTLSASGVDPSGSISATIPAGTAAGTGYRIRVVSSNPVVTGTNNTVNLTVQNSAAITAQPSTTVQNLCQGAAATALSVTATGTTLTYQWYSNTTATTSGGTPVGTSSNSYTPVTTVAGTLYYYCVVSAACGVSVTSNVSGAVNVTAVPSAPSGTINISANPSCGAATLTYSAPNANIYWQTTATGTSTANPTTSSFTSLATAGTYIRYVRELNGTCWSPATASASFTIVEPINITAQPPNRVITDGNNTTFTVTATGTTPTYQWQVDTGSGFVNLTNGAPYSNVTTATLNITGATIGMNGYLYRCIVSGAAPCGSVTSNVGTLTVTLTAPNNPSNIVPCYENNSIALSWTASSGGAAPDGYMVFALAGATAPAATTVVAGNASLYTANSDFSLATVVTASLGKCVYKGSGTSVTVTGLTNLSNYSFKVVAYRGNTGTGWSSGITALPTGSWAIPTTNITIDMPEVSALAASIASGQSALTWNRPTPLSCYDEYLVVANQGPVVFTPSGDGTAYTANTVYSGSNQVVYKSGGNGVTVTGLTNGTNYCYKVFVRRGTEWSDGVEVCQTSNLVYCASGATSSLDSEIENVTLVGYSTSISNNTTNACTTGVNNYTVMSADLQVGGTYTVTVEFGDCSGGAQYDGAGGVWIDWNNDGDFLDANETIGTVDIAMTLTDTNVIQNFTINVPVGQPIGNYRMRIVQEEGGASATVSPCGTFTFGSTEDYTVQVINACVPTHTVTTLTPTSGPVGTEVTINGTGLTGATVTFSGVNATVVSNTGTQMVVVIPAGATTGMLSVRDTQPCAIDNVYTIISSDVTSCEGASTTDLIIYELHDEQSGDGGFITLYNGTATTVNLANYRIYRAGDYGDAMSNYATLTGTIAPGALGVITVDADSCGTATNGDLSAGFNENDQIQLRNAAGTVIIDDVHTYIPGAGYYMVRNTGALSARTSFVAADWATTPLIAGQCIPSAGLVPPPSVAPSVITHPSYTPSCSATSVVLTTAGNQGFVGGNALAYQWFFAAPGSATWTAVTDGGIYSGATTASLTISSIVGVIDYQYYCQIRENTATCYTASNAIKITDTSATTWNGTTWSNGAPDLSKLAIINGNYDTTSHGDFECCSLFVNATFTLNIQADDYVLIQNDLTNNGTLNVFNNGSLVQVNDLGVNTGNISYQRIASVKLQDYVYWSSPVSGFDVNSISSSTPAYYHWEWNPTIANPNGGEGNWINASTTMSGGKGYIVRAPNGFSNTANQNWTATFNNGVPNNGVYTPTIARGNDLGAGTAGPNGVMRLDTDDNWNLLGNPYPSSISINSFLAANPQLDGFIRLWTHGTLPSTGITDPFYNNFVSNYTAGDYIALNGSGATSGPSAPGVIGAGQGFFVLMDPGAATTSTALFNNAMRSKNYSNSHFYRNANSQNVGPEANVERHRIWLDLVSPTNETTRTLVAYVEGATTGKDKMFDAFTDYKLAQNFYSLIDDQIMAIQGKGLPFEQEDRVPLGLKIPSNGIYKIAIATVDGLFSGNQNIYLEDKVLGVIHDLRQNPYSFTGVSGIVNDRFVLRYTNETLGGEDFINNSDVLIFSSDVISVNAMSRTIQNVKIYNVLGQLLLDSDAVNSDTFETSKLQKNNTTLLVQVTLENGIKVTKKIVF